MDIRNLQLTLKKKEKPSFYIISGEDEFLNQEAEDSLKESFKSTEGADIEVYYGDQLDYDKCLDSLNTLPFLSSTKVILIKKSEKLKVSFLEEVEGIFSSDDVSGLVLVLFFSKVDKRKKIMKSLLSKAYHVEVKTPYENQLSSWTAYIGEKQGIKINKQACDALNFLVGPSLIEIAKGVEKVRDVFDVKQITKEHVQQVISKIRVDDVFQICDLLGKAEFSKASVDIENSLNAGSSPIGMLNLFFRHFRILEKIIENTPRKLGPRDLAVKAGVPPYFLANYQGQSRSWSLTKLKDVFRALEAADLSLKSTRLSPNTVFSGFIMELTRIFGEREGIRSLSEGLLEQ